MHRIKFFLTVMLFISQLLGCTQESSAPAQNVAAPTTLLPPVQINHKSIPKISIPSPPIVDAKSYVLMDMYSGKLLAQKNADERLQPASLTKMMTLYLVYQSLREGRTKLNTPVAISKKTWGMQPSRILVKHDARVPLDKLILGAAVASGNDAAVALAEHIAGSEYAFVRLMNRQAKILGMYNTQFENSSGLPNENHYSTARDMAILAKSLIQHFPEYYGNSKEKWFVYDGHKHQNHNHLLWKDTDVDGVKTGYTRKAGYCLAASAMKNHTRLISVVMGAPKASIRNHDSLVLLNYGFNFFETVPIYAANEPITRQRVWMARHQQTPIGVTTNVALTLPKGLAEYLKPMMQVNAIIKAPIQKGQIIGLLHVYLNNTEMMSRPIVALADNPRGNLWRRLKDYLTLIFRR